MWSCYSSNKAERQIIKAQLIHPEIVSKKTMQWYPCITSEPSIDSTDIKRWMHDVDSIKSRIEIQIDTIEIIQKDSFAYNKLMRQFVISNRIVESLKLLLNTKTPTIYKTIYISDSSRLFVLQNSIDKEKLSTEKFRSKYEKWLSIGIWLLVALLISIIINIIQLKW